MRIELTGRNPGDTAVCLGDDSEGWFISGFFPAKVAEIDVAGYMRGVKPDIFDRQSARIEFGFKTFRSFATVEECTEFLFDHLGEVPAVGEMVLTSQNGQRRIPNAGIGAPKCEWRLGASCIFSYPVVGDEFAK